MIIDACVGIGVIIGKGGAGILLFNQDIALVQLLVKVVYEVF